jgi:hypothetical protein
MDGAETQRIIVEKRLIRKNYLPNLPKPGAIVYNHGAALSGCTGISRRS